MVAHARLPQTLPQKNAMKHTVSSSPSLPLTTNHDFVLQQCGQGPHGANQAPTGHTREGVAQNLVGDLSLQITVVVQAPCDTIKSSSNTSVQREHTVLMSGDKAGCVKVGAVAATGALGRH